MSNPTQPRPVEEVAEECFGILNVANLDEAPKLMEAILIAYRAEVIQEIVAALRTYPVTEHRKLTKWAADLIESGRLFKEKTDDRSGPHRTA